MAQPPSTNGSSAAGGSNDTVAPRGALRRLDEFVFEIEKVLVTVALLGMTAVVFFEVTARELVSPDAYTSALKYLWWKWSGAQGELAVNPEQLGTWWSYLPVWLVVYGVAYYAVRSLRERLVGKEEATQTRGKDLGLAVLVTLVCLGYGLLQATLPSQVFYFVFVLIGLGVGGTVALQSIPSGRRTAALIPVLTLPSIAFYILYKQWLSPTDDEIFAALEVGIELPDPADTFGASIGITALAAAFVVLVPAVAAAARRALNGWDGPGGCSLQQARLYLFLVLSVGPVMALLVFLAPADYGWATPTSTAMLIWVGFVGASMATKERRHIAPGFARNLLPKAHLSKFQAAGTLVACGFCAFLCLVSLIAIFGDTGSYTTEAIYEASQMPEWVATIAIPITLATMAARFFGHFVGHLRGHVSAPAGFDIATGGKGTPGAGGADGDAGGAP